MSTLYYIGAILYRIYLSSIDLTFFLFLYNIYYYYVVYTEHKYLLNLLYLFIYLFIYLKTHLK